MKHTRIAMLALAGAAACASGARAQLVPGEMVQGRVSRTVQIDGRLGIEYDTNVARTSSNLAALQGLQLSDTTYTPTLNADVVLPVGRQAVFLQGSVGYLGHAENKQLDHVHANVSGGLGGAVGPCGSVLTTGYTRSTSEVDNTTLATNVQNLQETKRLDLSISCSARTGFGAFVDGSRVWASNSIPNSANGAYQSTSVSGGLSYQRPAFGSLSLTIADSKTDYSQDGVLIPTIGAAGFESKSAGVSFDRKLGGRIEASASVSYTEAETEQAVPVGVTIPAPRDFSGVTYNFGATFRASSRLQANASFDRSVRPSLITGGAFELDTSYQIGVSYKLGSALTLDLTGSDHDVAVHGDIPAALAVTTLTDATTKVLSGSATYRLSKRISVVLTAKHETRDANNPLFAYDNNSIGLSTDVRF